MRLVSVVVIPCAALLLISCLGIDAQQVYYGYQNNLRRNVQQELMPEISNNNNNYNNNAYQYAPTATTGAAGGLADATAFQYAAVSNNNNDGNDYAGINNPPSMGNDGTDGTMTTTGANNAYATVVNNNNVAFAGNDGTMTTNGVTNNPYAVTNTEESFNGNDGTDGTITTTGANNAYAAVNNNNDAFAGNDGTMTTNGVNNDYAVTNTEESFNAGNDGKTMLRSGGDNKNNNNDNKNNKDNNNQEEKGERPIIYTYHEKPSPNDPKDDTKDLVETWKKSWYDVGWEPRVLSEEDASSHFRYKQLMRSMTSNLLDSKSVATFRRWIAMAAVGGWMADLQTLPLNFFLRHGRVLPHDGALTVYQGTIPSLVSGTKDEYLRIAHHLGKHATKTAAKQQNINENMPERISETVEWNDGIALKELKHKSTDMFKTRQDVVPSRRLFRDGILNCDHSEGKRAIFIPNNVRPKGDTRGATARRYLNQWRDSCKPSAVEDIGTNQKNSNYYF